VPPVPWDFVNEAPSKSLDEHLGKVPEKLFGAWGRKRDVFLDLLWVPPADRMQSGAHQLTFVLDGLRKLGVDAVPVTGPARDTAYQAAVNQAVGVDNRGACIRLTSDDLGDLPGLASELEGLQETLGLAPDKLDLVIDLQEVTPRNEALVVTGTRAVLNGLPQITKWRTLTLAAAAFPENLSDVPAGTVVPIPRADWTLWLAIRGGKPSRLPAFGDYAIAQSRTDSAYRPSRDAHVGEPAIYTTRRVVGL